MAGGVPRRTESTIVLGHLFTDGALVRRRRRARADDRDGLRVSPARLPGEPRSTSRSATCTSRRRSRARPRRRGTRARCCSSTSARREQTKSVAIVDASPGQAGEGARGAADRGAPRSSTSAGRSTRWSRTRRDVGDAWLRVFVTTDGPVPGHRGPDPRRAPERARRASGVRASRRGGGGRRRPLSLARTRATSSSPTTDAHHGAEPDEALLEAFDEVLDARDGRALAHEADPARVKGFTAFRDEQTIDFEAGSTCSRSPGPPARASPRSSTRSPTRCSARSSGSAAASSQLVSQGQPRMAVTFEFAVDGRALPRDALDAGGQDGADEDPARACTTATTGAGGRGRRPRARARTR